jgi:predicted metal-dependent peptidase
MKEKFNISTCIRQLFSLKNTQFYAVFLGDIEREINNRVPTAAISLNKQNRDYKMIFNQEFMDSLSEAEQIGVLIHETMHLIKGHFLLTKQLRWDQDLRNICLDLHINDSIESSFDKSQITLPEDGCFISKFPELNLNRNESSLYYYKKLKEAKNKKEKSKKNKEDSQYGSPGNQNGTSGSKLLDQMLDSESAKNMHSTWDKFCPLT